DGGHVWLIHRRRPEHLPDLQPFRRRIRRDALRRAEARPHQELEMNKVALTTLVASVLIAGCSSTENMRRSDAITVSNDTEASGYLEQMRAGKVHSPIRVLNEGHYMPLRQVTQE